MREGGLVDGYNPRKREPLCMANHAPVTLVTGCSSGLGRVSALELARRGHMVYATMRDPMKAGDGLLADAARAGVSLRVLQLDVTDGTSVARAVGEVHSNEGRIDVVINNAGVPAWSPVECYEDDEILSAFDTNVLGVHRVTREVLPYMREQRGGTLILVSSISGFHTWPFGGVYCATKAAAEALFDAMFYELHPFGIKVVIVQPGNFATSIGQNTPFTRAWLDKRAPAEYAQLAKAARGNPLPGQLAPGNATEFARALADICEEPAPRRRYQIGADAENRWRQTPGEREQELRTRYGMT
jgi:NAD(P)-dependent dehydrogenase (short-subunit alcohol dehydrogenase family)